MRGRCGERDEPQPRWRIDDVLARTRLDEVLDELAGAGRARSGRAVAGIARPPTTTTIGRR